MVDVALGRDRCPDPSVDRLHDLDDALASVGASVDPVADGDGGGGLGGPAIDTHVPGSTGSRRLGA